MRVRVPQFGDTWRRVNSSPPRRLTRGEQALLERERGDSDAEVHARIIVKEEEERFQRPRRGDTGKR